MRLALLLTKTDRLDVEVLSPMFLVDSSRLCPAHKNCYETKAPRQHILSFWGLSESQTPASILTSKLYLPKTSKDHQNNGYFLSNCEHTKKTGYFFFHSFQ